MRTAEGQIHKEGYFDDFVTFARFKDFSEL